MENEQVQIENEIEGIFGIASPILLWGMRYVSTRVTYPKKERHTFASINALKKVLTREDGNFDAELAEKGLRIFKELSSSPDYGIIFKSALRLKPFGEEELPAPLLEMYREEYVKVKEAALSAEDVINSPPSDALIIFTFLIYDSTLFTAFKAYVLHLLTTPTN